MNRSKFEGDTKGVSGLKVLHDIFEMLSAGKKHAYDTTLYEERRVSVCFGNKAQLGNCSDKSNIWISTYLLPSYLRIGNGCLSLEK